MPGWFDYAICDEIHQLAGYTAQGNALGTLASCSDRIVGLTGTLLGGYADDLFNTLFRLEAGRMKEHGYEWGTTGRSSFTQDYGVLETITKVEPADNKCSKAKTTTVVRRKPGASPLLFGEFLMQLCAFVFLEDISGELPPYEETYLSVALDPPMREAYGELEDDIRQALKEHRGNRSVLSTMLNTLLLYPDHPYGLGTLYGAEFDSELKRKVPFVIAKTRDLPEDSLYSKERRLLQEIKQELAEGRRCQVFAVYTRKHAEMTQFQENTLTAIVDRNGPVKLSFFGSLGIKRVHDPDIAEENGVQIASLLDLLASKLKTIHLRAEMKDYRDIVAMFDAGLSLAEGLAAAAGIYGKEFNGALSLKALTFFQDGDLPSLTPAVQKRLLEAATSVNLKELPLIMARPGLSPREEG
jgi:hypothetical protein